MLLYKHNNSNPAIRVLTEPNRGASAARNRALAEAEGDYIQWLAADDLLAADKIARQMRDAEPGATSRVLIAGAFGEFIGRLEEATFRPTPLWQDLTPTEFLLRKFRHNVYLGNNAWLVSRRLTAAAGPWDERPSLDDDREYFSGVFAACEAVRFIHEAAPRLRRPRRQGQKKGIGRRRQCPNSFRS
jgi:glycosyltransferase involved in cell wall biosynthesis